MSTYIVGDVQGCYEPLTELLSAISFNPLHDTLGFAGDMVNRGPDSLSVLRMAGSLKNSFAVLGNHDLALLALHFGAIQKTSPFLTDILEAPDRKKLMDWLLEKPLLKFDKVHNYALVHAGIPPQWSIETALQEARETEILLQKKPEEFLKNMYGNLPDEWSDNLSGWDRTRYVINAFTRMRFCTRKGKLDFENTSNVSIEDAYRPWFDWRTEDTGKIIFGHWASLLGRCEKDGFYALDTGCVWGKALTALEIDSWKIFQVDCE